MKKNFKPTAKTVEVAKTIIVLKALVKTLKPEVAKIRKTVLAENKFQVAPENKHRAERRGLSMTITEEKFDCLMSEADSKQYYALLHIAFLEAGIESKEGFCPLRSAEFSLIDAEKFVVKTMESFSGISWDDITLNVVGIEKYNDVIDLNLKFLANWF